MDIFEIQGNIVIPSPHALLIPQIGKVWNRDLSDRKSVATLELSYIEFCLSGRKSNPFEGYSDDERPIKVAKVLGFANGWRPDRDLLEAMEVYSTLQNEGSQSYRYYISVKKGLEKLINFYETQLDFTATNNSGSPIYKPKDITDAISKAAVNMQQVQKIKEQVEKELFETNRTIKNRDINEYEKVDKSYLKPRTSKYT